MGRFAAIWLLVGLALTACSSGGSENGGPALGSNVGPLARDLSGGSGAVWQIRNDGGTSNGLPQGGLATGGPGLAISDATMPPGSDAFDRAGILFVDNAIFVPPSLGGSGQQALAGPVRMSGVDVTVEYFAATTTPTLRTLVSFRNPGAAPANVVATWVTNVGSDENTVIAGTSNGVTSLQTSTPWLVTCGDPEDLFIAHVLFGPNNPVVTPASVSQIVFTSSFTSDGVLARYNVQIPAGQTRRLMFFHQLSRAQATALQGAQAFDSNPAPLSELLTGLGLLDLAEIVNWRF